MISSDEVARIAALAKVALDDAELARMQRDLGRILDFVDQIKEIGEGQADEPADGRLTPLRPDEPRASLDHDEVAANASHFLHGHFVVPRILGGE